MAHRKCGVHVSRKDTKYKCCHNRTRKSSRTFDEEYRKINCVWNTRRCIRLVYASRINPLWVLSPRQVSTHTITEADTRIRRKVQRVGFHAKQCSVLSPSWPSNMEIPSVGMQCMVFNLRNRFPLNQSIIKCYICCRSINMLKDWERE